MRSHHSRSHDPRIRIRKGGIAQPALAMTKRGREAVIDGSFDALWTASSSVDDAALTIRAEDWDV